MKVFTYSIIRNERQVLPWFVRHYSPWVDRMIFMDDKSDDGSVEYLRAQPKCEVREWPYNTGLDDEKFIEFFNDVPSREGSKNNCDFVAVLDADEILFGNFPHILENASGSMIPATGYALISKNGYPVDDGKSQVYDLVKTGAPQPNYSKRILFRPNCQPQFAHGRHHYPGQWPKHRGTETPDYGVKLLHLHHLGGILGTIRANKRNYERAHDKKYAWNYSAETESNPNQVGTTAWIEKLLATNALIDVVGERPLKIQLGSGGLNLPGFRNHDVDVNICKPLPFKDNSCSHIVISHCIEHVKPSEAWTFLEEAKRVLMPGGVIRVSFPDMAKLQRDCTQEYQEAVKKGGHGDGSKRDALKACVFCHGHQGAWTAELMETFMTAIGFSKTRQCEYGLSEDIELCDIDQHHKTVSLPVAVCETSVIEGIK